MAVPLVSLQAEPRALTTRLGLHRQAGSMIQQSQISTSTGTRPANPATIRRVSRTMGPAQSRQWQSMGCPIIVVSSEQRGFVADDEQRQVAGIGLGADGAQRRAAAQLGDLQHGLVLTGTARELVAIGDMLAVIALEEGAFGGEAGHRSALPLREAAGTLVADRADLVLLELGAEARNLAVLLVVDDGCTGSDRLDDLAVGAREHEHGELHWLWSTINTLRIGDGQYTLN